MSTNAGSLIITEFGQLFSLVTYLGNSDGTGGYALVCGGRAALRVFTLVEFSSRTIPWGTFISEKTKNEV